MYFLCLVLLFILNFFLFHFVFCLGLQTLYYTIGVVTINGKFKAESHNCKCYWKCSSCFITDLLYFLMFFYLTVPNPLQPNFLEHLRLAESFRAVYQTLDKSN